MARKSAITSWRQRLRAPLSRVVPALFAIALLCLSVGVVAPATAHSAASAALSLEGVDNVSCDADGQSPPRKPGGHASHMACCLACEESGLAGFPTRRVAIADRATTPPRPGAPPACEAASHIVAHPVGWATSWSSQAPPHLS
jgi:hypothetical protein